MEERCWRKRWKNLVARKGGENEEERPGLKNGTQGLIRGGWCESTRV